VRIIFQGVKKFEGQVPIYIRCVVVKEFERRPGYEFLNRNNVFNKGACFEYNNTVVPREVNRKVEVCIGDC
jgi:hypothetical protein